MGAYVCYGWIISNTKSRVEISFFFLKVGWSTFQKKTKITKITIFWTVSKLHHRCHRCLRTELPVLFHLYNILRNTFVFAEKTEKNVQKPKNRNFNFAFSLRKYLKIAYMSFHRSETSFVSTLSVQIFQKLLVFMQESFFDFFWVTHFQKQFSCRQVDIWACFPRCRLAGHRPTWKCAQIFSWKKLNFAFKVFKTFQ